MPPLLQFYNLCERTLKETTFNKEPRSPTDPVAFLVFAIINKCQCPALISTAGPLILAHSYYSLLSSSQAHLSVPLKSAGLFSSANANVRCIVTGCSFLPALSPITSLPLSVTAPLSTACRARIIHRVRTNEWVWRVFPYLSR